MRLIYSAKFTALCVEPTNQPNRFNHSSDLSKIDVNRQTVSPGFANSDEGGRAQNNNPSMVTLKVVVTGGAGQIAYSLVPLIARGLVFGPGVRVHLRLLDIPPAAQALEGELLMFWYQAVRPRLRSYRWFLLFQVSWSTGCSLFCFVFSFRQGGNNARRGSNEKTPCPAIHVSVV